MTQGTDNGVTRRDVLKVASAAAAGGYALAVEKVLAQAMTTTKHLA